MSEVFHKYGTWGRKILQWGYSTREGKTEDDLIQTMDRDSMIMCIMASVLETQTKQFNMLQKFIKEVEARAGWRDDVKLKR